MNKENNYEEWWTGWAIAAFILLAAIMIVAVFDCRVKQLESKQAHDITATVLNSTVPIYKFTDLLDAPLVTIEEVQQVQVREFIGLQLTIGDAFLPKDYKMPEVEKMQIQLSEIEKMLDAGTRVFPVRVFLGTGKPVLAYSVEIVDDHPKVEKEP